jgi:hypothetical protein
MKLIERIRDYKLTDKQSKVIGKILEEIEASSFLTGHEICGGRK